MVIHDRKKESKELLNYLIKLYDKEPSISDIRLGQLIVNYSNPVDPFFVESSDLLAKLKKEYEES